MVIYRIFISFVLIACSITASGQRPVLQRQNNIVLNEKAPSISFGKLYYSEKDKFNIEDWRGKAIILDFFSKGCVACFASLPKINALESKFNPQLKIIMVGKDDGDGKLQTMYEFYRKSLNLQMSVTYIDKEQVKWFDVEWYPHLIWIDPQGYVRGVTSSNDLTEENIISLIKGKPISVTNNFPEPEIGMDYKKPFLLYGNGGPDSSFVYRSILAEWNPRTRKFRTSSMKAFNRLRISPILFQCAAVSLPDLYNYAFWGANHWLHDDSLYGKTPRDPVFEIADTSRLRGDYNTGRNLWTYSLSINKVRKDTISQLKEMMQNDLENYFGYKAAIEMYPVKYWKVSVDSKDVDKLKTSGGRKYMYTNHAEFTIVNHPVSSLIARLGSAFQEGPPFIDETGLVNNIDLSIHAMQLDFDDFRKALFAKGIKLELSTKLMPTVVVRDK